jgi:transcriptional regulator with XRE-family HTH domain
MVTAGLAPIDVIAVALRHERERAGLSAAELARRANIAKSTVSQLESGSGNPSVETLWAISTALGIPFSRLVDLPGEGVRLIRMGDAPEVSAAAAPYAVTLLSACAPNARRDLYLISAEPGSARESEPHQPGVTEHIVMVTGHALLGPIDAPVEMGPGDYVSYPGDERHTFQALAEHTIAVLVLEDR